MRGRDRKDYENYGNLFFVTSTVVGFLKIFEHEELTEIMIDNLKFYQERGDFTVLAYVIMPNHFHLILKITPNYSISRIIGNFKRITSRQIREKLKDTNSIALLNLLNKHALEEPSTDSKLWKPRFDCLVIINEKTLIQKIEYIHNNPVKSGLVNNGKAYPCSSVKSYMGLANDVMVDTEWNCLNEEPSGKGS